MNAFDLVNLAPLMAISSGHPQIKVGIIDGPVFNEHLQLAGANLVEIGSKGQSFCQKCASKACQHGTFITGMLAARRDSSTPGICPGCSFLIRPIFFETASGPMETPSATPDELAAAIIDSVDSGVRVINLSAAIAELQSKNETGLGQALDYALQRGVIVVAAAGNQGTVGTTSITRHPWVIPAVGCDQRGQPLNESNISSSIGRRGLMAPGQGVTGLMCDGRTITSGGTSVSVPFVTGTIALLWSQFPELLASELIQALAPLNYRRSIVPPLLDAQAAFDYLKSRRPSRLAA